MIKTLRRSIDGPRPLLEQVITLTGLKGEIIDYPVCSTLYIKVDADTRANLLIEEFMTQHELDGLCHPELRASKEELQTEPLFRNVACRWIEDDETIVDPPDYTGVDRCKECGKGAREHNKPLSGALRGIRRYHLIRLPPALVLGSKRLVSLIKEREWTGVEIRPYIERANGQVSDSFSELWITSVLPPMHTSAPFERTTAPDFCASCRRLGYDLRDLQPVYEMGVVEKAADWNLTREWWAAHAVSCPGLICSNRVVNEVLKLEKSQRWIPVKLVT